MTRALFVISSRLAVLGVAAMAAPVSAQQMQVTEMPLDQPIAAAPQQEVCINVLAGFPDDSPTTRYQFLKLTQDVALDADANFRRAIDHFGDRAVTFDTPVLDVIEAIANPVIRQAAPELTIGHMGYLIDFHDICGDYIRGQVDSLAAYDSDLADPAFNVVIGEDALYMRQILVDTLYRLDAQNHGAYGLDVQYYAGRLVATRDHLEFTSFTSSIDDIEASFMTDLDGKLARSNDIINKEMDREVMGDAASLMKEMNEQARKKRQEDQMRTLFQILNRYGRVTL